ncbi:hypothetical protein ACFSHQ_01535 [Gemmobacter lanyuensis]
MTVAARPQPDTLPGELLMWVLILSELLVFGAGFAVLLGLRLTDPRALPRRRCGWISRLRRQIRRC